jgi:hypothetical protein
MIPADRPALRGREVPLSGGHLSRQSPTAPGNYLALWPATARTFRAPERRTLPTPRRFLPAPTFGVTFGAVPLRDDRSPGGRAPDVAYVPGGRAGRCPEVLAVTFGVVNRELAAHADVHAMDSARGTRPAPRCPRLAARSGGISFALTPVGPGARPTTQPRARRSVDGVDSAPSAFRHRDGAKDGPRALSP